MKQIRKRKGLKIIRHLYIIEQIEFKIKSILQRMIYLEIFQTVQVIFPWKNLNCDTYTYLLIYSGPRAMEFIQPNF